MDDYSSATRGVIIKTASSALTLDQLMKEIGKTNRKNAFVQILDPKKIVNKTHLLGAYINAIAAIKNKSNISDNHAIEMLLFAAMSRQISDAITKVGAKSTKRFVVFASSNPAYAKINKFLKEEKDFNPNVAEQTKIAKGYGINQQKEMNQFLLQKIAMSRLEG